MSKPKDGNRIFVWGRELDPIFEYFKIHEAARELHERMAAVDAEIRRHPKRTIGHARKRIVKLWPEVSFLLRSYLNTWQGDMHHSKKIVTLSAIREGQYRFLEDVQSALGFLNGFVALMIDNQKPHATKKIAKHLTDAARSAMKPRVEPGV